MYMYVSFYLLWILFSVPLSTPSPLLPTPPPSPQANQLIAKVSEDKHAKQDHTSPLTTDSTHHSESELKEWESVVHTTIKFYEKTTELSTHQSHGEENLEEPKLHTVSLDVHNGTTIATVTASTTNAGNSEQCSSETATGLCIAASDSSNYCPTDLQELNADRDENTREPEILDNGPTLGNPIIRHSNGHKDLVNNDTIEIVNL